MRALILSETIVSFVLIARCKTTEQVMPVLDIPCVGFRQVKMNDAEQGLSVSLFSLYPLVDYWTRLFDETETLLMLYLIPCPIIAQTPPQRQQAST